MLQIEKLNNYSEIQKKYKNNLSDMINISLINTSYNIGGLYDYSSIDFLNNYLLLRYHYVLRNDLFFQEIKEPLNKLCFKKYTNIENYYTDIKSIRIKGKLLIHPMYYKVLDKQIKFLKYMIETNKNFSVSRNSINKLNNYIDNLEGV